MLTYQSPITNRPTVGLECACAALVRRGAAAVCVAPRGKTKNLTSTVVLPVAVNRINVNFECVTYIAHVTVGPHMSSRSFADLAYDLYASYWRDARMSEEQGTINGEQAAPVLNHNGQGDCMYHAFYVPPEDADGSLEEASARVYREKLEALKVMKKYKTGRMKTFNNREDAEEYARNGGESDKCPSIQITAPNEEKASNFRGPKPQELVTFRKLIESGDLEAVKNIAWENPRYLVSSGDTPAILQEGCRYNALHIIAAKGQSHTSQMCELILNTVGNPEFVRLLYGEEDCKSYVDRAQILVDLYLNTPDKGLNETPLHFAAKYGLKDIVRVLVSYSECVKTLRNKYGQTPVEVICSRKCQDEEVLKRDIRMLLEDQYYVPVLRSEDNTLQPTIGDPFSPTSPPHPLKVDPMSPRVEVRAFAGPMTKPQAVEFRRKWKTPPRLGLNFTQRRELNVSLNDSFDLMGPSRQVDPTMRLQDTEKGLERIGRDLAEECHVEWKEFWPFLKDFADLRRHDGLARIEKYLEQRFQDTWNKKTETRQAEGKNCVDDLSSLCNKLECWTLEAEDNNRESDSDDEYYTPPTSPQPISRNSSQDSDCDDEMCLADEAPSTFIEGPEPTKTDIAVYNAISSCIDQATYPYIYRWRHEMKLHIDNGNLDCTFFSARRKLLRTPDKLQASKF